MAINITEGCMDATGSQMVCNMDAMKGSSMREAIDSDAIASREGETIPFHKHCQATVCSAHGYNGSGKTWNILYPGYSGNLSNLQKFVTSGTTWQSYFERNNDNITQDLRSILELMNLIAGSVATSTTWTLTFKDENGGQMESKLINPWSENDQNYVFANFGRTVNLTINNQSVFKFHTLRSMTSDSLNASIPSGDLTVEFNGRAVGTANSVMGISNTTLQIQQDYNTINMGGVSHQYSISTLNLNPNQHAYRVYMYSQASIPLLKVNLSEYDGKPNDIVEFELHMINNYGEVSRAVIAPPSGKQPSEFEAYVTPSSVWRDFSKGGGIEINALTDKLTVDAHTANVYIVRLDFQRWIVTYSLAYTYPFTT